jgi:hypothetical protein
MPANENNRETGARKLTAKTQPDASDEFSEDAAKNKQPAKGMGLTEPLDDVNGKTRHSDGRNLTPNSPAQSPTAKGEEYGPRHSKPDRTGLTGRDK